MTLLAMALALPTQAGVPVDIGIHGGVALSREGTDTRTETRPAVGGQAGVRALSWVRGELQATSAGVSTPGSTTVTVSTWWADLGLLGGASPGVELGKVSLGVDLLAGPSLRYTRTAYGIYDRVDRTGALSARLAVGGGPWLVAGPLRLGLRGRGYTPRGHHGLVLLTAAAQL